jgi:Tol biopolymer transport system component
MKTHLFLIIAFVLLSGLLTAQDNKASVQLSAAIYEEEVTGNLDKAVELYLDILKKYPDDRAVAAKSLYHLGLVNEKMGKQKASKYFTRLVNTYPDQTEVVALAKTRLIVLGGAGSTVGTGGLITRRVLTDASEVNGFLTADGKYIRFMDQGTGDVVQFEVASGQTTRIKYKGSVKKNEHSFESHVFSRDGKQIAYNSSIPGDTSNFYFPLQIRNLDGSVHRTIDIKKEYVQPLDWSPDGGSILALSWRNDISELTLIAVADGSERLLKSFNTEYSSLQSGNFSPDGRFVAFSLVREGSPPHSDIFLINAEGRNEVVIAGHPAEDQFLGWTPDGNRLVFLSDRSGTRDIWTVRINGGKQQGEPEQLKNDFGRDSEVLGFAPDGSLYYKNYTRSGGLYKGEIDPESGKIIVQPVQVTTRYIGPPDQLLFSPDGSKLLYIPRLGNQFRKNNTLVVRSASTEEERILSPHLSFLNMISWSPDSRSILALGIAETRKGIFRIDSETGGITKLAGDNYFTPHLCPDGKTLVIGKVGPIIAKCNLETGEESEIVKIAPTLMGYDLSPDGREVVFQVNHTVKIMSINGGEARELFNGLARDMSGFWEYDLKWTKDGRFIIARASIFQEDHGQVFFKGGDIWRIPSQGGTPVKLDLAIPNMTSFALHPDNRRFAFSVNEGSRSELWVLENFLPK